MKTINRSRDSAETTQKMNATDYEEVQLDEKTYRPAEKRAKKTGANS